MFSKRRIEVHHDPRFLSTCGALDKSLFFPQPALDLELEEDIWIYEHPLYGVLV